MRPNRNVKAGQLRVRLLAEEREALDRIVFERRKDGSTLSDVVREALQWYLSPDATRVACSLSGDTFKQVEKLSKALNREPRQVLDDCVMGIVDQLTEDSVPLIVQEWKLRQNYRQSPSSSRKK